MQKIEQSDIHPDFCEETLINFNEIFNSWVCRHRGELALFLEKNNGTMYCIPFGSFLEPDMDIWKMLSVGIQNLKGHTIHITPKKITIKGGNKYILVDVAVSLYPNSIFSHNEKSFTWKKK